LRAALAAAPDIPTLLAVHHPPLATGIPGFDKDGLPAADRRELAKVVEAHPQVRQIVAGHMHRAISGELGGRPVLVVPSTYVQAQLEFGAEEMQVSADPAGFAVHALVDGEVVSYVQTVR
jgi:3',5'-cyclic AMP phosphodiesterase CpdA